MIGRYFHVALRYRNFNYLSQLSPTGHLLLANPVLGDIFMTTEPQSPKKASLVAQQNRIYLNADPGPEIPAPGCQYIAEILFDYSDSTKITGTETNLLSLSSALPVFTYDVPLMQASAPWVHARIAALSLSGLKSYSETIHCELLYDVNFISEQFLNLMASKMAEKIQTQDGNPLTAK